MNNPRELEIEFRVKLILLSLKNSTELDSIKNNYLELLKIKPTWPYFYSGLLQVNQIAENDDLSFIEESMRFGPHETKIIKSLAEVLFYRWRDVDGSKKLLLLNYLTEQSNHNVSNSIKVASKFGQVNTICDYLFEKYAEKNAVCLKNYWKPLVNERKK